MVIMSLLFFLGLVVPLFIIAIDSEPISKLGRSKTMSRKEAKKYNYPKTPTDSVVITANQMIVRNQGLLSDCYVFEKQLGEGKEESNKYRELWNGLLGHAQEDTGEACH